MVSDHFYLTMQTVTLKRLTSWPCLSLSVSSYLLRDFFFQALSAGRTHSVQICTTTRRKRRGVGHSSTVCERRAALHIQLDWMQGIIPLSKLGFHSSTDCQRRQSSAITIKWKHFTSQRQTRIWTNEKWRFPWGGVKREFSSLSSLFEEALGRMFLLWPHKAGHELIMPEPNWNLRLRLCFVIFDGKDGKRQKGRTKDVYRGSMKSSPLLDCGTIWMVAIELNEA